MNLSRVWPIVVVAALSVCAAGLGKSPAIGAERPADAGSGVATGGASAGQIAGDGSDLVDAAAAVQTGALPRYLTEAERAWLERHPPGVPRALLPPPSGPIHCVAEYEPMEGLLMAWEPQAPGWSNILGQIARYATTLGDADIYCVLDTEGEQVSAANALQANGADMARVRFLVRTTDSIWIRDYGPRYIYEGDCRAIIDHQYNRPRPNDDVFPQFFSQYKRHALYDIPLRHGGGNFHLDALGRSYVTRLINNENPQYSEQQIHDLWRDYQNVDTTFFDPFRTSIDSTQHIDMWMQVYADRGVMISDWPVPAEAPLEDAICDAAATLLGSRGYVVTRVPARHLGGVHYTYTNVVMCNDVVMIPTYSNPSMSAHNAEALASWQSAVPGKSVVQIESQPIVSYAGVLHCVVMHVPVPRRGADPSVYLRNLRGGDVLQPGDAVDIRWISDDDERVASIDILLSINAGVSYDRTIAQATEDDGLYTWTVPDVHTARARVRLVARDAGSRTGQDESPRNFTIGRPCPGDLTGDRTVDQSDLGVLLAAFGLNAGGDLDDDGDTDQADLGILLGNWQRVCP